MTVSYVWSANGFCQANISYMRSGLLPSTRLAIYALDPPHDGLISEEALPSKVELSRLLPVIVNSTRVSALEAVKEDRLVFCASESEVTYEGLTAEGCNYTWIRMLLTNCFLVGGIPLVLLTVFAVFIAGLRGRERHAPFTGAFVYFTVDPTIPDVRMYEEALQMSNQLLARLACSNVWRYKRCMVCECLFFEPKRRRIWYGDFVESSQKCGCVGKSTTSGQTRSRTASPPSLNLPRSIPTRPHGETNC
ncbi:hypothetical protein SprV_0401731800 [Sparganum proliferum]